MIDGFGKKDPLLICKTSLINLRSVNGALRLAFSNLSDIKKALSRKVLDEMKSLERNLIKKNCFEV